MSEPATATAPPHEPTVVLVSTDPIDLSDEVRALEVASGRRVRVAQYRRDRDVPGGWRAFDETERAKLAAGVAIGPPGVRARAVRKARRAIAKLPPPLLRRVRRFAPGLPLGTWRGDRGPGVTPGSLLGRRLLREELAPEARVALVVAGDRQAAAGAWFAVQARPEVTAVHTVEAALRYLALASRRGTGDLEWHPLGDGDQLTLDVPGLPEVVRRDSRVLVVAGSADTTARAAAAAALGAGGIPVLLLPADVDCAFLHLDGNRLDVTPAPDPPGTPADAGAVSAYAANLAADAVVLADPSALVLDPRATRARTALLLRVVDRTDPRPAATGELLVPPEGVAAAVVNHLGRDRPEDRPSARLLIGPANYAGQGAAWAGAVVTHVPGAGAVNLQVAKPSAAFGFPADYGVLSTLWSRPAVRAALAAQAVVPATHVLLEAMRPLVGVRRAATANGWDFAAGFEDLTAVAASGRSAGVVLHGSEARRPGPHAQRYAVSPFGRPEYAAEAARLTTATSTVHELLARWDGPVFVSTLDLLDDVPEATWLPVVVGADLFRAAPEVLARARPVVVHAPSSPMLKGSEWVDPLLERLDAEGLVEYRRMSDLPSAFVGDFIREADVVVDQVVLGNPGVLAAQAMAAGRVVVAHLLPQVRERFPLAPPVVEATPAELEAVVRDIVADRERYRQLAADAADFARELHDGRRSAAVLAGFLGQAPPARC